ncbi:hypothetical protein RFI_00197 [Reticulomyxa filosa]|uniref:Uncharacterized protein n=1 Tax=Reticulomyxa filosa TaxID=46433 RepID=X6PFK8_RETFI|nr:hypothetical protein RFI_00197 [Reticulomyxa filosa]|eukprot:ETO36863.1 hypothetical protein RFI_00197 [Reticulomyxa filosa]
MQQQTFSNKRSDNADYFLSQVAEKTDQTVQETHEMRQTIAEKNKKEEILVYLSKDKSERTLELSVKNSKSWQKTKESEKEKELIKMRATLARTNEHLDSLRLEKDALEVKYLRLAKENKTLQSVSSAQCKQGHMTIVLNKCKNLKQPLKEIQMQMIKCAQIMDVGLNELKFRMNCLQYFYLSIHFQKTKLVFIDVTQTVRTLRQELALVTSQKQHWELLHSAQCKEIQSLKERLDCANFQSDQSKKFEEHTDSQNTKLEIQILNTQLQICKNENLELEKQKLEGCIKEISQMRNESVGQKEKFGLWIETTINKNFPEQIRERHSQIFETFNNSLVFLLFRANQTLLFVSFERERIKNACIKYRYMINELEKYRKHCLKNFANFPEICKNALQQALYQIADKFKKKTTQTNKNKINSNVATLKQQLQTKDDAIRNLQEKLNTLETSQPQTDLFQKFIFN